MGLSYLVSTAGHAQEQNDKHPHDIETILQLIEDGAKELGDEKVVGFAEQQDGRWRCKRYIIEISTQVASDLMGHGIPCQPTGNRIIAMLCPTGPDFLFTWIALMRMGYGVVLVALLKGAECKALLYHPKYEDLAKDSAGLDVHISITPMTPLDQLPATVGSSDPPAGLTFAVDSESTSHVFHTSGSSGNPKPIPNQHLRSVSSLPRRAVPSYLSNNKKTGQAVSESAAFTTTPLFHGGVSDLLRAWMACSMLYLYPTSDVPITPQNVVDAVDACQAAPEPLAGVQLDNTRNAERTHRFKVTAFLSVPYILTILTEEPDGPGMAMLKGMEFVSTGGAPLDTQRGDLMVKRGVHLVSRLGSSECGFLLSSHRDYETELDWEWLRNDSAYADALVFEPTDDPRKFQMIVTDQWRSKSKTNRPDGSYETGDLYIPHPEKPNTWKYVGRGDDVIVMSNGEKASPGPIETVFRSSSLITDALVVGSDRPQLGLLLFVKSPLQDKSVLKPLLDEANRSSPSFAQLSLDMCDVLVTGTAKALPKSSKGTVQRGSAYEAFAEEIEAIYTGKEGSKRRRSLAEIQDELKQMILHVAGEKRRAMPLDADTDLFTWGVDSLMAIRIRASILKTLDTAGKTLPVNVVFEKPSIRRLAQHIHDLQEGQLGDGEVNLHQMMLEYAIRYAELAESSPWHCSANHHSRGRTILLTGATGSLGAFVLSYLTGQSEVERVICPVRAGTDADAQVRLTDIIRDRHLSVDLERVEAVASSLSEAALGLGTARFDDLATQVDAVIHAAWPVHFASSLVSFEDSFRGLRNLLSLVRKSPNARSKLFFCSSLASVLAGAAQPVAEELSDDPATASPVGYSQSKWVAEQICAKAASTDPLQGRVKIMRIGQLCGDTVTGRWNEKEGWPLLIGTAQSTGFLPALDQKPAWLPVDLAAKAIVDMVLGDKAVPDVCHIAHPQNTPWNDILDGLQAAGLLFDRVSPEEWLSRLARLPEEDRSRGMLPLWQNAYASGEEQKELIVETMKAQAASPTMRQVPPISRELISKMVAAWRKSGFLSE